MTTPAKSASHGPLRQVVAMRAVSLLVAVASMLACAVPPTQTSRDSASGGRSPDPWGDVETMPVERHRVQYPFPDELCPKSAYASSRRGATRMHKGPNGRDPLVEQMQAIRDQMEELARDRACREDDDCAFLWLRSCTPAIRVVYSTRHAPVCRLHELAVEYYEVGNLYGWCGGCVCSLEASLPEARCVESRCVEVPSGVIGASPSHD